jgi:DNA-binding Xre family transcriptional regulator
MQAFQKKKQPLPQESITQEQQVTQDLFTAIDQLESQKGKPITELEVKYLIYADKPIEVANTLYTTENEARTFWRNIFGEEPTEAQLGQMIGQYESTAKNFVKDLSATDASELNAILKRTGADKLNLTAEQKANLFGLSEQKAEEKVTRLAQAANILESQGGTLNQNTLDYLFKSQNPVADANALYTTEAEAKDFWRQTVGTEPTANDLMDMIGLTESAVKTQVGDIAYDRANVSSDELDAFVNQYGQGKISLTDAEKMDLLGRSEADVKNAIIGKYNEFLEDKKSTDGQEAIELWKKAGLSESDLTQDQLQMMRRGSEAEAETYARNLADVKSVTYQGDPAMDQAATEAAAKASGYNNYTYGGKTYLVNDRNIAAAFDGGLQQETNKLVQRVLEANGLSMADMTQEQVAQIRNSVHAVYGNDVNQIKGASAQDFLTGSTRSQKELTDAINNRDYSRVVVNRAAPAIDEIKDGLSQAEREEISALSGVRLANSKEAFEDNSATQIILSNGRVAYVINKEGGEGGLNGIFEDLDLLRQQQQLSPEDPRSADPLLYLEAVSKLDPNKSTIGDSLIDTSKYLVNFINSSNLTQGQKQGLTDAVSVTLQGSGELVQLFSDAAFATGLVTRENAGYVAAKKVAEYGASIQSASTQQQEENIKKAISDARGVWGTLGATVKAIANNPAGALTMVGKEGVQEGPLFLASGGLGRLALGLAGKGLAYATATGSNVFLNGAESFGANFGETYDNVRKQGGSHEQAMTQGQKAGAQAALASGLLAGVADKALLKTFMGDVGKVTLPQFTGMAAKQYAEGWGSEFVENAAMQYNSYGKVDFQQARNAGAIGGILEMGVGTGLMAPEVLSQNLPVAKDLNGNVVTLSEYMSGTKQVQPGSFNMDAITVPVGDAQVTLGDLNRVADVATSDPNFSLATYKTNLDNLADAGYDDANIGNIALTVTAAPNAQTLTSNLQSLGLEGADLATAVDVKFDSAAVTPQEAQQAFSQYGYFNPDQQMIQSFVGVGSDANLQSAVADYVDRNYLDIQEVKDAAAQQGVTLTDEQAQQYVKQAEEAAGLQQVQTSVDPLAITKQEAIDSLIRAGYTPDLAAAAAEQFVGQYAESELEGRTQPYVAERQITFDEAKAMLEAAGYKPSDSEVNLFVATGAEPLAEPTRAAIQGYVDPRTVTAEEVRQAYQQLGLEAPTEADVNALIGQYAEADLAQRAESNLPVATVNAVQPAITELGTRITDAETRIREKVDSYISSGLASDEALQAAIDDVAADLGVTKTDLLAELGTTEAKIREDFAAQIGGVQTQIGDVETRLTNAIAAAEASGLSRDQAIQAGLDAVAADLGVTKTDLLAQIGETEQTLRGELAETETELRGEITGTQKAILDKVAEYEAAGITRDEALNRAIQDVSTQLGQTETDLRGDIEAAKATLGTQITEQVGGAETRLQQAIDEAIASGQKGDQALQTAINSVATELGVTKTDILTQLGKTETDLRTEFGTQLGAVTETVEDLDTRLNTRIDELVAQGKTQYDATNQALREITAEQQRQGTEAEEFEQRVSTGFEDIDTRIGDLMSQGKTYQEATNQALGEMGGQLTALQAAQAAEEQARQEQAAQQRASGLRTQAATLLPAVGALGLAGLAPQQAAPEEKAQFIKPFFTGKEQEAFVSPLQQFLKSVQQTDYAQPEQEETQQDRLDQQDELQEQEMPQNYFNYGQSSDVEDMFIPGQGMDDFLGFRSGGLVPPLMAMGGTVYHSGKHRTDYRQGSAVTGPGDGQSDDIPAMLADGEYVIDAEIVAALGNGSTKAGSKILDDMRKAIRAHKRSGPLGSIPPKAKSPLEYIAEGAKMRKLKPQRSQ